MKLKSFCFGILILTLPALAPAQSTNNWLTIGAGKWEIGSNWSLGAPRVTQAFVRTSFTMLGGTAFIDAATVASNGLNSCMTVSNLIMSASGSGGVSLNLTNASTATPFRIRNTFSITGGFFSGVGVSNSVMQLDGLSGGIFAIDAFVTLYPSGAITGAAPVRIGNVHYGEMDIRGGTWLATGGARVGNLAGSLGTLSILDGSNTVSGLTVGTSAGATGTVSMTGGQLTSISSDNFIGFAGAGQMTVSGGTLLAANLTVGDLAGSRGTLTMSGGTNTISGQLFLGETATATGSVWVTGGEFVATNANFRIGRSGVGKMTVSNGTARLSSLTLGDQPGSRGLLTVVGGSTQSSGILTVGNAANATGTVLQTGGLFDIGLGVIGNSGVGEMTVSNGTFLAGSFGSFEIGRSAGGRGTLTIAGGTAVLSDYVVLSATALARRPARL